MSCYLQFPILNDHFRSESFQRFNENSTLSPHGGRLLVSRNSLQFGYILNAGVFLQFPILIRNHFRRDSFILQHCIRVSEFIRNWIYLNDAVVFLQFPILIRILHLTVPNHSRDSFILIKFNTFSSWREIVSVHSNFIQNKWISGIISVPNHSRDSFILIKFNTLPHGRLLVSIRVRIHEYNLMMQENFRRILHLMFRIIPEIHLF